MPTVITARARAEIASQVTEIARADFRAFLKLAPLHKPYQWGRHTYALAAALQSVSDAVIAGERKCIIVIMPPRHGKSDLVSRRFPVWHLARAPQHELILSGYSGALMADMSGAALRCAQETLPRFGVALSPTHQQTVSWSTELGGGVNAVGLGGTITGRGAHILAIDDYLKGRQEAESALVRNTIWEGFRNDLLTRLAPAYGIVIACTRWHTDDLVGRIYKAMAEDPDFPKFETVRFPAHANGKWLFPQRFSEAWYQSVRAGVGSYAWQALYQGDPQPRGGNMFRVDRVQYLDKRPPGLRWVRGWDLASSRSQRTGDDPDYTAGALVSVDGNGGMVIADMRRLRLEAPERDRAIIETSHTDDVGVYVAIETVAGYKDTGTRIRKALEGSATVAEVSPKQDLLARSVSLEAAFEGRRVTLVRGEWNKPFLEEMAAFPSGAHDDQLAAVLCAEQAAKARATRGGSPRNVVTPTRRDGRLRSL